MPIRYIIFLLFLFYNKVLKKQSIFKKQKTKGKKLNQVVKHLHLLSKFKRKIRNETKINFL